MRQEVRERNMGSKKGNSKTIEMSIYLLSNLPGITFLSVTEKNGEDSSNSIMISNITPEFYVSRFHTNIVVIQRYLS